MGASGPRGFLSAPELVLKVGLREELVRAAGGGGRELASSGGRAGRGKVRRAARRRAGRMIMRAPRFADVVLKRKAGRKAKGRVAGEGLQGRGDGGRGGI